MPRKLARRKILDATGRASGSRRLRALRSPVRDRALASYGADVVVFLVVRRCRHFVRFTGMYATTLMIPLRLRCWPRLVHRYAARQVIETPATSVRDSTRDLHAGPGSVFRALSRCACAAYAFADALPPKAGFRAAGTRFRGWRETVSDTTGSLATYFSQRGDSMMRIGLLSALTALLLPIANTAFAQDTDEPAPSPKRATWAAPKWAETSDAAVTPARRRTDAPATDSAAPTVVIRRKARSASVCCSGYGISLEDGANPWGFGFGARGGYNIGQIYLRRSLRVLSRRFGGREDVRGVHGRSDVNSGSFGVEGGYDVKAERCVDDSPKLGIRSGQHQFSFISDKVLGLL